MVKTKTIENLLNFFANFLGLISEVMSPKDVIRENIADEDCEDQLQNHGRKVDMDRMPGTRDGPCTNCICGSACLNPTTA